MNRTQNNNYTPIIPLALVCKPLFGLGCMINTDHYNAIDCDIISSRK